MPKNKNHKFAVGDIVILVDDSGLAAKNGSTARVIFPVKKLPRGRKYIEVEWIKLIPPGRKQSDVGYYSDSFELAPPQPMPNTRSYLELISSPDLLGVDKPG